MAQVGHTKETSKDLASAETFADERPASPPVLTAYLEEPYRCGNGTTHEDRVAGGLLDMAGDSAVDDDDVIIINKSPDAREQVNGPQSVTKMVFKNGVVIATVSNKDSEKLSGSHDEVNEVEVVPEITIIEVPCQSDRGTNDDCTKKQNGTLPEIDSSAKDQTETKASDLLNPKEEEDKPVQRPIGRRSLSKESASLAMKTTIIEEITDEDDVKSEESASMVGPQQAPITEAEVDGNSEPVKKSASLVHKKGRKKRKRLRLPPKRRSLLTKASAPQAAIAVNRTAMPHGPVSDNLRALNRSSKWRPVGSLRQSTTAGNHVESASRVTNAATKSFYGLGQREKRAPEAGVTIAASNGGDHELSNSSKKLLEAGARPFKYPGPKAKVMKALEYMFIPSKSDPMVLVFPSTIQGHFICKYCDTQFTWSRALHRHLENDCCPGWSFKHGERRSEYEKAIRLNAKRRKSVHAVPVVEDTQRPSTSTAESPTVRKSSRAVNRPSIHLLDISDPEDNVEGSDVANKADGQDKQNLLRTMLTAAVVQGVVNQVDTKQPEASETKGFLVEKISNHLQTYSRASTGSVISPRKRSEVGTPVVLGATDSPTPAKRRPGRPRVKGLDLPPKPKTSLYETTPPTIVLRSQTVETPKSPVKVLRSAQKVSTTPTEVKSPIVAKSLAKDITKPVSTPAIAGMSSSNMAIELVTLDGRVKKHYWCNFCAGRFFSSDEELNVHKTSECDDRHRFAKSHLFECCFCPKQFLGQDFIRIHLRDEHQIHSTT